MAKKSETHYKKMNRSEEAIKKRLIKEIKTDVTVEELEDYIIELKQQIDALTKELKELKQKHKSAQKGLNDSIKDSIYGINPFTTTTAMWEPIMPIRVGTDND